MHYHYVIEHTAPGKEIDMRISGMILLAAVVAAGLALAGPASAAGGPGTAQTSTSGAAPSTAYGDLPINEAMARALYRTARAEAQADFWLKIANALNGPLEDLGSRVQEARIELREDLDLAEAQYAARREVRLHLGNGGYDPQIEPADFSTTVSNPYMPLIPGRTLIYEMHTAEGVERKEVSTYNSTFTVAGFDCRVVRELELFDGVVIEDTTNWYAQDTSGNVWYFGEIARHYEDGILDSLEGSWRVGKDEARAGRVMLANPQVGDIYRQEYAVGVSEDLAKVISMSENVSVPAGNFQGCLMIGDWSPIEPDDVTTKFYYPSVGLVMEVERATGDRLELVQIIN
jgi:hypothetical protein